MFFLLFSLFASALFAATYVLDPSYNRTVDTFLVGAGMWVSPKDNELFFVTRDSEGGPYHLAVTSTLSTNSTVGVWKTGDWQEPEDIEVIYENNQTKVWFADQSLGVISRFDPSTGKVDGHIGTEGNTGCASNEPIQFQDVAEIQFVPESSDSNGDRLLFFGDDQPFMTCHRWGKLKVLLSESSGEAIKTETIFVVGTNGNVNTNISFEDITTIAYDVKREWLWINDYIQYQVFIYDGNTGQYINEWPCNAGHINGGVYFDRKRDIFWQVMSDGEVFAYDVSSITSGQSVNSFNCKSNQIFNYFFRQEDTTGLAIDSRNSDVYLALSYMNARKGCQILRYKYQS